MEKKSATNTQNRVFKMDAPDGASVTIIQNHDLVSEVTKNLSWLANHPMCKDGGNQILALPNNFLSKPGECINGLVITGIGSTITPNVLGNDLGMGHTVIHLKGRNYDFEKINNVLKTRLNVSVSDKQNHKSKYRFDYKRLRCYNAIEVKIPSIERTMGTLGIGTVFVEVLKDPVSNDGYLLVRAGGNLMAAWVNWVYSNITNGILTGQVKDDYIHDAQIVQEWAKQNRKIIAENVINGMQWNYDKKEYKDYVSHSILKEGDTYTIRKGAIVAKQDATVAMLVSCREGLVIGSVYNAKESWLNSAPAGSGRVIKPYDKRLNMDTYTKLTIASNAIYSFTVNASTLPTSPMVYRRRKEFTSVCIAPIITVERNLNTKHSFKGRYDRQTRRDE